MRTSKLLRGLSVLSLLFCAAGGFGQTPPPTPVPLITQVTPPSLSPANLAPGSNSFTLTILGANFAPGDLVELTGPVGGSNPPTAIAFNATVNATGTQMVANFTNVFLPVPGPLMVRVTKRDITGAPLLASNPYYLPVTPSAQTVMLESPVTSFLPGNPTGIATADFNGDGVPDLAVLSQLPNTVSILTGNIGGSFTAGASYAVGNWPSGVVAADFDGDHVPDLAVTSAHDNTVTIFLGNGDGTFRPGTTISDPGMYPTQLVAADFNGDGKMDLAVVNACGTGQYGCYPTAVPLGPANVAILLGNGDGTFNAAPTMPATGLVPTAIAATDLNQDGFIDLVVANSSNNLTLLMGNGDGTFSAASNTPSTGYVGPPTGIAIGDFNGDGTLDVAVTSSGDQDVAVLLNENCAGLPAPQCALTPMPPELATFVSTGLTAIATADMNADGLLDLVVANSNAGTVSMLLGDGTGKFNPLPWPNQSFPTGSSPQALALIDFNLDGRLDVVTANGSGSYSQLKQMGVAQVTLTTSNTSPFYGLFLSLTATINPAFNQPTPTGTVTFYDGPTSVGTAVLSGYQALLQFSTLTTGTHQLTAVYNGDGNFLASTSNAITEVVTQAQTTITLGSNANMVPFGQPFTLTANVQPQNTGTPTGTVSFVEIYTSTSVGSAALVNGAAQLTLSNLSPGAHVITATYNGDSNFTGSSSPTYQENITQASTNTTVTTSASPVLLGQTPTFTATVQPSASTAATGFVTFFADGSTRLGTAPVTNNSAQLQSPVLSVGPHSITAQYEGDTNYTSSTASPILETVNPAADTVTVSANPIVYGQQATLVATVQPVNYSGTPTGTITFSDGSTVLGMATLSNGSAQFTAPSLVVGTHSISASYSGDANFQPATSPQFAENVWRANTTTAVTSGQNPSSFSQPVLLTATVQPAFGGAATGNVTFYDGLQSLGTSPLSGNMAVLSVSSYAVGTHTITASYVGDSNVNGSASAAMTQTVNPSPTSVTLTSNSNPSTYGQNVTFSAAVQAAFGTAPPSTISFYDGTTLLGTFNTTTATQITISYLTGASHSITAQYAGNSNFASSTSAVLTQTVNPASTTTTVFSNLNPSSFGQPVTLTAAVDSTYHFSSSGGTVTFYDNGVAIGSTVIVGNGVSLTISSLGTGTHSITASYGGDSNLAASTSAVFTQTVNQAAVSPTIALSSYAFTYGQTLTMTSNVKPAYSGTPTGTVTFWLNWPTTALGTGTIVNGTAQATTTAVPVGSRSIYATYNGDTNFASGSSLPTQLTISQASTTTVASADLNPANYGQAVTLTAAVQSSGGTPTGSVTFLDGTTTLGIATLANGVAQLPVSSFGGGSHSITAKYSGDANFSTSTSAVLTETVNLLPTTTTVASNLNPATFGQAVTLTATVQAGSGVSVVGTVTFLDGSLGLGTVTLANNSAQFTTSTLAAGAHTLTAVYNSNGNFAGSTSAALTETVNQLTTTTTLASSVNPALAGQTVTFTATVQAGAGNSPVGAVTFLDGSTTLGSTAVINNSAQLTISTLAPGSHSITAAYSGSTDFAASTSSALTETVNQSSTTTTLVSNLNPATFGQAVPFVATVQTASGGAATGSVTFYDGATVLGTAGVVNNNSQHNIAQLLFAGFLGGTHTITAAYSGDANYTASTSSALTETINSASSTVTVGASPNPASFGQAVTLTATVVPSISGDQASGTVTFFDGANSLGAANLSNNVAQISVANFALGSHSITATYAGDRNFAGSTSSALSEAVNPASTSTVVTSNANPAVVKSNVTFTATVSSSIAGTQSGTVNFYLDGSSTAAASVNLSNGAAKYSTNSLSAGSHSIVAVFTSSNPVFAGSSSPAFTQFVSDFTVDVSPTALTVARGTSGMYTLTVIPVGEFSGTVSLSCGGAPGGTTCAISPAQVTLSGSGSAQATVTITAAQNASKKTSTLTFTGTSGGLNHKITASLTID